MGQSIIIAIGAIITMMAVWVLVQQKWGEAFSEDMVDEDPLAGRSSCGGAGSCGCSTPCKNRLKALKELEKIKDV